MGSVQYAVKGGLGYKVLMVTTALAFQFLASCGGGGSSSSGGGIANYVGTYKGTILITISDGTANVSDSAPITVVIANDGRVDMVLDGVVGEGSCSGGDNPVYLNGNSFSDSATLNCTFPQIGRCTVSATMNGRVANDAISGTGRFIYRCTAGNFTMDLSYTAKKVLTSSSLSGSSVNDGVSMLCNSLGRTIVKLR